MDHLRVAREGFLARIRSDPRLADRIADLISHVHGAGAPPYDCPEGIKTMLYSLSGFNSLIQKRREAHHERHESLKKFIILGRWWTDQFSQWGTIVLNDGKAPKEHFTNIPGVLTEKDFRSFMQEQSYKGELSRVHKSMIIPPERVVCPECKQGWTIGNCHDAMRVSKKEVVLLTDFVGKTLGYVQQTFLDRGDAVWFMQSGVCIRNDRFIDSSPDPDSPGLQINRLGWVGIRDGITSDYIIQSGDEGHFTVSRFYHGLC